MPKPKSVTAVQLVRLVEKLGFRFIRQSGSHATYRHFDGRWTIIPIHKGKTIGRGLLRKILHDLDLTAEEFNEKAYLSGHFGKRTPKCFLRVTVENGRSSGNRAGEPTTSGRPLLCF